MLIAPLVYSAYISLFTERTIGGVVFVGLGNYLAAASDPLFWEGLGRTMLFLLIQVPIMLGLALLSLTGWLVVHDVARRTIRARGVTRYMAACILAGYVWLTVAGLVLLLGMPASAGALDRPSSTLVRADAPPAPAAPGTAVTRPASVATPAPLASTACRSVEPASSAPAAPTPVSTPGAR